MSGALAERRAAIGDHLGQSHLGQSLGDTWHQGTGLIHEVAEATAERAGDAGHAVGAVAERAASIAGELGRAAAQRAAAAATGLRESATDITGRERQRRRRQAIVVRRGLVVLGVVATIGLLALAARRARTPWAEEANAELEPGDPRAEAANGRRNRQYAAAT